MRKLFLKTILLIVIVLPPVWLISRYDNLILSDNHNVTRIQNSKLYDHLDYLFLGNSYTYSGINPTYFDTLGIETYNLGIATAGSYYYELLLNDYLAQTKVSPRQILLLISPMTFSHQANNWLSYPIHRYLNQPVSHEQILLTYNIGTDLPRLIQKSSVKGLRNIKKFYLSSPKSITPPTSSPILKGFVPSDVSFSEEIYNQTSRYYRALKSDKFSVEKFDHLLKLAQKYQNKNIGIIFYEMPTFRLKEFFSDQYLADYEKAIRQIPEQGFTYLPCDIELDAPFFRNIDHLNTKGATVFTQYLIDQLAGLTAEIQPPIQSIR